MLSPFATAFFACTNDLPYQKCVRPSVARTVLDVSLFDAYSCSDLKRLYSDHCCGRANETLMLGNVNPIRCTDLQVTYNGGEDIFAARYNADHPSFQTFAPYVPCCELSDGATDDSSIALYDHVTLSAQYWFKQTLAADASLVTTTDTYLSYVTKDSLASFVAFHVPFLQLVGLPEECTTIVAMATLPADPTSRTFADATVRTFFMNREARRACDVGTSEPPPSYYRSSASNPFPALSLLQGHNTHIVEDVAAIAPDIRQVWDASGIDLSTTCADGKCLYMEFVGAGGYACYVNLATGHTSLLHMNFLQVNATLATGFDFSAANKPFLGFTSSDLHPDCLTNNVQAGMQFYSCTTILSYSAIPGHNMAYKTMDELLQAFQTP